MQEVRLGRVAPVVDRDDCAAVGVAAHAERWQLLRKGKPVILRLALRGAEEMYRLGRGSGDQGEHIWITQEGKPFRREGLQVVAQHEDPARERADGDHHPRLVRRELRRWGHHDVGIDREERAVEEEPSGLVTRHRENQGKADVWWSGLAILHLWRAD